MKTVFSPFTPSKDPVALAIQESAGESGILCYYIVKIGAKSYDIFLARYQSQFWVNKRLLRMIERDKELRICAMSQERSVVMNRIINLHACKPTL